MRKEITIKITDEKLAGRDVGKEFVITEMSAFQTEMWSLERYNYFQRKNYKLTIF